MAKLLTYQPNGIKMPRELVEQHLATLAGTYNDQHARPDYAPRPDDNIALLHDVFRTRDGRRLVALDSAWHRANPRIFYAFRQMAHKLGDFEVGKSHFDEFETGFRQLKRKLSPLRIFCDGRELKHKYKARNASDQLTRPVRPCFGTYEIALTDALQAAPQIELEFIFGDGAIVQKVSVPQNPFADLKSANLLLHTLQKDNFPQWIDDWCKYYHREHGVKRIVIYDNASTNLAALHSMLEAIADPLEVVLINWNCDYNLNFNQAQRTALNHCPQIFGDSAKFYMNFDLDEYLVNRNDTPLEKYLLARAKGKVPSFNVKQRIVSDDTAVTRAPKQPARVTDFEFVRFEFETERPKTINVFGKFSCIDVHYTVAELSPLVAFALNVTGRILEFLRVSQAFIVQMRKFLRFVGTKIGSAPLSAKSSPSEVAEQTEILYFNHYKGLTTGWKPTPKPASGSHIVDAVMIVKLSACLLTAEDTGSALGLRMEEGDSK